MSNKPKKTVTIQHGDDYGEVMPQSVSAWQRNGWTVVDDSNSGVEEDPAPAATTVWSSDSEENS